MNQKGVQKGIKVSKETADLIREHTRIMIELSGRGRVSSNFVTVARIIARGGVKPVELSEQNTEISSCVERSNH